jgi:hydrogenase maturation protein HypF
MGIHRTSFEGQGPILLEALADDYDDAVELPTITDEEGIERLDWSPLLSILADPNLSKSQRAALFYNSLAEAIANQALVLRRRYPCEGIGLTGGVFQNRRISEQVINKLGSRGVPVYLPMCLPCNDGGLSYGQIVEAAVLFCV